MAAAAKADAERMARLTPIARAAAEARCGKFRTQETSFAEERAVGAYFSVARLRANKLYDADGNAGITSRVVLVGTVLARRSSRPDLPWTFGVVESKTPNAFHAPGGYVFVTTGLLARISNEAELAGVLAHEIAHVAARHPLVRYRDAIEKQCIAATFVAELARNGVSPSPFQKEFVRFAESFSTFDLEKAEPAFMRFLFDVMFEVAAFGTDRTQEDDADRAGAELTAFAGYDATQFEALLTRLDADPATKNAAWLSNKPPTAERLAKLKALREFELQVFAQGKAKPDLTTLFAPLEK